MRHPITLACLTCLLMASAVGQSSSNPDSPKESEPQPSPRMVEPWSGEPLPTPPMQGSPWEPPSTTLPAAAVEAARSLFQHGMADPRGCEYRQVQLVQGNLHGNAITRKTNAWVLPAEKEQTLRFAVAWNGWVHPLLSVGGPADMQQDVESQIFEIEQRREVELATGGWGHVYNHASEHLGPADVHGLSVCMLLRLGHGDLADRVYRLTFSKPEHADEAEPYIDWARDWMFACFSRTVTSFMHRNDELALAGARSLLEKESQIEIEAERRGIRRPSSFHEDRQYEPYVNFLGQITALRDDLERRLDNAESQPFKIDTPPDRESSNKDFELAADLTVEQLVDGLEDVTASQWGQPGWIEWSWDPVIDALINKGEAAVPALIVAARDDGRLTRSIGYHRNFFHSRYIGTVKQAAWFCLRRVLDTKFTNLAEAEAYWDRYRDTPVVERWYQMLQDDDAGTKLWLQAAAHIARPADRKDTDGPRAGEALRDGREPSVLSLMAQRAADISSRGDPGSERTWAMQDGCRMALSAARWAPMESAGLLAKQNARALAYATEKPRWGSHTRYGDFTIVLPELAIARIEAGDVEAALDDYGTYVLNFGIKQVREAQRQLFEPVWRYAELPAMAELRRQLFLDEGSRWNPFLQAFGMSNQGAQILRGQLLQVPEFRQQLLTQLADQSEACVVTVDEFGEGEYPEESWVRQHCYLRQDAPAAPPPGSTIRVRVCDVYAAVLSPTHSKTPFVWYAPIEQRDAGIAGIVDRLNQQATAE